jgi:hypothetical protein
MISQLPLISESFIALCRHNVHGPSVAVLSPTPFQVVRFQFDRLAPRARSAAVRQNARPLGRGQGELYKNVHLPYRARKPAKRTPVL